MSQNTMEQIVQRLLATVDDTDATVEDLSEVVMQVEDAVRSAPSGGTTDVVQRVYVPSKTLPTVEIIGEPVAGVAQVRSIKQKTAEGRSLTIIGLGPDADYAVYLCKLADKAVRNSWDIFSKTDAVKALPNSVRSTYRRTYQRELCGIVRRKLTELSASRIFNMTSEEKAALAQKRNLIHAEINP